MPRKPKKPTPEQPKPWIILDDEPLTEADKRFDEYFTTHGNEVALISDPVAKAEIIADYRRRMATPPGQTPPAPAYRRHLGGGRNNNTAA